jgi:citrate synthase
MTQDLINTKIWNEIPETDDPFAAKTTYCRGFNVYGEMVGQARWVEMLALLFRDKPLKEKEANLLEALAVGLANPGPRDPSIHAAMCGGVCGSLMAASLIAALSVAAGRLGGARDVYDAMVVWQNNGQDPHLWGSYVLAPIDKPIELFPTRNHIPGFDPNGATTSETVREFLSKLADIGQGSNTVWLKNNLDAVTAATKIPLAMTGVAAAVLHDLDFTPEEGEMLYLILRLPGAAAHALEQKAGGFKQFPFGEIELEEQQ